MNPILSKPINEKKKERFFSSHIHLDKANLGKAGEYLVAGKLLLSGFNVYLSGIDDGIDLIARKRNRFIYIQVKTCQDIDDDDKYTAKVNAITLNRFPPQQTFLVFVLHSLGFLDLIGDHTSYIQDYVVVPVSNLNQAIGKMNKAYTVRISVDRNKECSVKAKIGKKELDLADCVLNSFWQLL